MHTIKKLTIFILGLTLISAREPVHSSETAIERFQDYENSIVTIRAQTFGVSPNQQKIASIEPTTGKMVILENRRIQALENTGAGVIIDPSGIVATNTHIIFGSQIIKVILNDGTELTAEVVDISRQYDFSLLKIHTDKTLTAIKWADPASLQLGEEVITIGHSPLLDKTISGGKIIGLGTRTSEAGTTPELIQININLYEGDSGGPVFDRQGRFLGLMNAKRLTVDKAALAIPADKIHSAYLNLADTHKNK